MLIIVYRLCPFQISVSMGVGWTFGFVASFVDTPSLWWIFILITSFHGVFLFIGFVSSSQFGELIENVQRQNDRKPALNNQIPMMAVSNSSNKGQNIALNNQIPMMAISNSLNNGQHI